MKIYQICTGSRWSRVPRSVWALSRGKKRVLNLKPSREAPKPSPITDEERRFVYTVLTDNGPDVDMWSPAFGRLVGRAKKAGVTSSYEGCYRWLKEQGYFGRKSDSLRAEGDKFYG